MTDPRALMSYVALVIALVVTLAQAEPAPAARIAVERDGDRFRFTALYSPPPAPGLTYRFDVEKAGPAGRSSSTQGGAVVDDTLSTSVVNASPGDRLSARLTVHDGDRVVAEDAVEHTVPHP